MRFLEAEEVVGGGGGAGWEVVEGWPVVVEGRRDRVARGGGGAMRWSRKWTSEREDRESEEVSRLGRWREDMVGFCGVWVLGEGDDGVGGRLCGWLW